MSARWVESPNWDVKVGERVMYLHNDKGVHRKSWAGLVKAVAHDSMENEPMLKILNPDGTVSRRLYDGIYGNPGRLMVWR